MKQILIIEDDSDQALMTSEALCEAMADVSTVIAITGHEALKKNLAEFDAILLDYNLPDMTGLDALREIVGREHGPVIMVTGEDVLEIAVEALKIGAEEFLTKTVDIFQLLPHVVQKTISSSQQKKKLQEMETAEREKKIQIDTLKRVMMTLAHHINNAVMPIIISAELCQRGEYTQELSRGLVDISLEESSRINDVIEKFEYIIEHEEFNYADYTDLKDAMFDIQHKLEVKLEES
ncbi:hypothetical protein CEE37_07130 [candidate division LCP-89 bacterium B3_LCP]|uniref:Response regulatory domain-containing protein n=1 Tax=candidate division LCP-89 bacterium B3_LCP TaxID=2012998 RepID=A0A532V0Q7_UNCL8|nr:MAG: hypothetical protein CEE37_07130 [candidate division LCP-89 bacterium B3_LCP]